MYRELILANKRNKKHQKFFVKSIEEVNRQKNRQVVSCTLGKKLLIDISAKRNFKNKIIN